MKVCATEALVRDAYEAGHRTYTGVARATGCTWTQARYWFTKLGLPVDELAGLQDRVKALRDEGKKWRQVASRTCTPLPRLYKLTEEWGMAWGDEPIPMECRKPPAPLPVMRRCSQCAGILNAEGHICQPWTHPLLLGVA